MLCEDRSRLTLQFHITGRCNLRCKHCYRTEGDVEALSYGDVIRVIDQFMDLRERYNARRNIKKRGHINITGGEPLLREDIQEILRYLGAHRGQITYGLLSNGSFLDSQRMQLLRETGVSFVQLSVDGDQKTHDALRAPGDYRRVLQTAQRLEKAGILTYISFTANRENYKQLPKVARECRKRHITKLWSDRLLPIGNGEQLEHLTITQEDLPSYLRALQKARGSFLTEKLYPGTQVAMDRALQFIGSEGHIYSCSAGNSFLTVDEFGRVMPCRRMPIICGNTQTQTLTDIYEKHPVFTDLRNAGIPRECAGCAYNALCAGGARCQSYALHGTYRKADPACFLKYPSE